MAGEERERSFEKALARNLRAGAGERAGAARPDACARAETLAAYHERLLAPEEMTFWKEHIAGCARCQEILAHVEETQGIAVDAAEREESVVPARGQGHLAGYRKDVLAMAAPRGAAVERRRPKRWVWAAVVPAGAIAAGLLVWVAVNQREKPVEMARNQRAPVAVPSAPRSEATPASREVVPKAQAPTAPAGARRDESQSLASELKSQAPELSSKNSFDDATTQLDQRIAGKHAAAATKKALRPPAPSAIGTGSGSGQGVVAGRAEAAAADGTNRILQEHERAKDLPTQGRNSSSLTAVGGAAAPAAGPAPAPPPVPSVAETVVVEAGAAPTPSPATVDGLAKTKAGVAGTVPAKPGQQTQQMEGMSRFREKQDFRLANVKGTGVIAAPGGKVNWRVGVAGTIERSEDSGATWTLQSSGVVADLLAGSAVSEKVCWVVGRLGTVLRTTDGGAHWVKVQAPVQEDITSAFAVSAQEVTISTVGESYRTDDGGATWKKLATE